MADRAQFQILNVREDDFSGLENGFRVSQAMGGAKVEFPDQPISPDFSSATAYVGPARAVHPPLAM